MCDVSKTGLRARRVIVPNLAFEEALEEGLKNLPDTDKPLPLVLPKAPSNFRPMPWYVSLPNFPREHAILRAKERYDIDLTREVLWELVRLIEHGSFVRYTNVKQTYRDVCYGIWRNRCVKVVFQPPSRQIITFLPFYEN